MRELELVFSPRQTERGGFGYCGEKMQMDYEFE